jgi:hypothetical protein
VLDNGNIGIGTTSPAYPLDIAGTLRAATLSSVQAIFGNGSADSVIQMGASSGGARVNQVLHYGNTFDVGPESDADLGGDTNIWAGAGTAAMTFLPTGKVGIGTTNPAGALDVEGSGVILLNSGAVGIGTTTPNDLFDVVSASPNYTSISISNSGGTYATSRIRVFADGSGTYISHNWNPIGETNGISSTGTLYQTARNAGQLAFWGNVGTSNRAISLRVAAGSGSQTMVDAITILGNRDIGVGTTSPYSALTLWGPDTAAGTSAFVIANSASTTEFNVLDNGNATLAGTLTQNSDQRLKTNIQSLDASSSLSLIDALNPVSFNWIDPNKGTTPQVGFIAQQVQPIFPNLVSTTSATALTPNGTLSLNYIGLISPIVAAIQALSAELSSIENTIAGFAEKIVTGEVDTQKLCVSDGPSDQSPLCVTKTQLAAVLSAQAVAATTESVSSSGAGHPTNSVNPDNGNSSSDADPAASSSTDSSATPPVLQVNGDNPAIIQVGVIYTDLGATITGPQADLNLGITTYVNGTEMNPVQLDTSTAATDTIDYVATDQSGLTSTTTRTIIVEAAPSVVPSDDPSTTEATSTAQ